MSAHTHGPLFVSIEPRWPFRIITTDLAGDVVFSRDMPSNSTAHRNSQEAMDGKGLPPEWNAGERNRRALADERLRAVAPELLESAKELAAHVREMCRCLSIPEPTASLERYEAAIAKATPEAKP